jgi:hypothetical protein
MIYILLYYDYRVHLEFGRLNFSDPEFLSLGSQFCGASPGGAVLRIGGSAADDLVFLGANTSTEYTQRIQVDGPYWDSILAYAAHTGCRLVWDLCALSMRRENGSWDSANAEALLDHIVANNQVCGEGTVGSKLSLRPGGMSYVLKSS